MQKLFTAKLDEEDFDRLREVAAGRPLVEVLRGWIRDGGPAVYTGAEEVQTVLDGVVAQPVAVVAAPGAAGKSWKSAEAFVAAPPAKDVHVQCDATIERLEAEVVAAKARYEPLLGALENVYAACARQGEVRQYMVYADVIARVRAVVDTEVPF